MLDVKMWIEKVGDKWQVLYEHYDKGMATKAVRLQKGYRQVRDRGFIIENSHLT